MDNPKKTLMCSLVNEVEEKNGQNIGCCNCNTTLSVKQQVLSKMVATTVPLTALRLSKFLDVQKGLVNKALYELERRGDIQKRDGTPPQWAYSRSNHKVCEREENLRRLLMEKGCMSSHSIAWELEESIKIVNRILYDLEKEEKVERVQLSPPIWKHRDFANDHKRDRDRSNPSSSETPTEQLITKDIDSRAFKNRKLNHNVSGSTQKGVEIHRNLVESETSRQIAEAVWNAYRHQCGDESRKDIILAGYVLSGEFESEGKEPKKTRHKVVALGTGTKSIAGDKYSLEGTVVHDCHAEIVARKSLIRWLYEQISNAGESHSFAVKAGEGSNTPYTLRPFELWLYCSQAPCGDAAVFSRSDPQPIQIPCFTTKSHGIFRTKPEAGHPGMPASANEVEQSFDGWQLGNRSYCHTCSDKIAKWCVVGVQGALLAQLIPPLFTTGIIIGEVFAHGHAARAICCRSERALENFRSSRLSSTSLYGLRHPKIGHWSLDASIKKRSNKKRDSVSVNWALGDTNTEVLDATTGRLQGSNDCSRISKKSLFRSFQRLSKILPEITYKEAKSKSEEYHYVKGVWIRAMVSLYGGKWVRKPAEVDDFTLQAQDESLQSITRFFV